MIFNKLFRQINRANSVSVLTDNNFVPSGITGSNPSVSGPFASSSKTTFSMLSPAFTFTVLVSGATFLIESHRNIPLQSMFPLPQVPPRILSQILSPNPVPEFTTVTFIALLLLFIAGLSRTCSSGKAAPCRKHKNGQSCN